MCERDVVSEREGEGERERVRERERERDNSEWSHVARKPHNLCYICIYLYVYIYIYTYIHICTFEILRKIAGDGYLSGWNMIKSEVTVV